MSISPIQTPDAPGPSGGYSQGILAQVRQVFANLQAVAEAAAGSLSQMVRVGVYLPASTSRPTR